MSTSLGPDQARRIVCKGYQQTAPVGKELKKVKCMLYLYSSVLPCRTTERLLLVHHVKSCVCVHMPVCVKGHCSLYICSLCERTNILSAGNVYIHRLIFFYLLQLGIYVFFNFIFILYCFGASIGCGVLGICGDMETCKYQEYQTENLAMAISITAFLVLSLIHSAVMHSKAFDTQKAVGKI